MAKPCKKCDPHEICEECPEWIFTLADLIMCMMGLFVILWVLKPDGKKETNPNTAQAKQEQSQEFLETIGAIRSGFGWTPDPYSKDPVDVAWRKKLAMRAGPANQGTQVEKNDSAEGIDPTVTSVRPGKQTVVGTRVQFDVGLATLGDGDRRTLDQIADQVRGHQQVIYIKGHASPDDFPEETPPQQFMDLSLRRAQAASDYLTQKGVSPQVLRVLGCSTFEPLQQRAYTPAARRENRRVDVEVTSTLVREFTPEGG